jgi:hypothetical protein
MAQFVGLDVSQKLTSICVVDDAGRRLWRGQYPSGSGSGELSGTSGVAAVSNNSGTISETRDAIMPSYTGRSVSEPSTITATIGATPIAWYTWVRSPRNSTTSTAPTRKIACDA